MSASVYPATLPNPSVASVTPAERRLLSDVTGGPQQARGMQRDYLGSQSVEWSILSASEAASLETWWRITLEHGGAWFSATWPAPQGWVAGVRRFIGVLRWFHLPGGFWKVSAVVQVRGVGITPSIQIADQWSIARSNGAIISTDGFTASYSTYTATGVMSMGSLEQTTGKRYLEYFINQCYRSGSNLPAVGLGPYPFAYTPGSAGPTSPSFTIDPYGQDGFNAFDATGEYNPGDVVMIAVDLSAATFWYGRNGAWQYSGDPATGANPRRTLSVGTYAPLFWAQSAFGESATLRTSQQQFTYAPPTGFIPWGN